MSSLIRNFPALLLPCLVLAVTGCAHTPSPDVAQQNTLQVGHSIIDARSGAHLQKAVFISNAPAKPVPAVAESTAPEASPATDIADADTQSTKPSLTLQLGDCLLTALKTLTGH